MNGLSTYLEVGDILLGVRSADKSQLFEAIGRHVQAAHGVPAQSVVSALRRREMAGSTALGHGVAVPHARVAELDRIRILYVRLSRALHFDAPDGQPVSDVVVLMVPAPATQDHLDLLARVAELFSDGGFRATLHGCHTPDGIRQLFERRSR
jgi:nitrogen PTS system EIIA component